MPACDFALLCEVLYIIDSNLWTQVSEYCKTCNFRIRAIRHVWHLLLESTALTLACSLINSRLDYCIALLYGAPKSAKQRSSCGSGSKSSLWCQAAASPAPLPASASMHCVQDSGDDAEGSHDRCSSLPERTSCPTRCHPPDTFCCTSTANCPESKYCVCQTLIFIHCTCHLEQFTCWRIVV